MNNYKYIATMFNCRAVAHNPCPCICSNRVKEYGTPCISGMRWYNVLCDVCVCVCVCVSEFLAQFFGVAPSGRTEKYKKI